MSTFMQKRCPLGLQAHPEILSSPVRLCRQKIYSRTQLSAARPSGDFLSRDVDAQKSQTISYQNQSQTLAEARSSGTASTSGSLPSAKETPAQLDKAKERRSEVLTQYTYNPYKNGAPGIVDIRLYQSAVESQKRMSVKLSEANAHMYFLERRLDGATRDLQDAADFLKKVAMDFGATSRLVESTAASVRFGVDKEDAVGRLVKLCDRLEALEASVQEQRVSFSKRVPKRVPVAWVGVASEVRLMGDFDGWTRGLELSAGCIDSDGVIRTFEAELPLRPGRYRVKFLVDGDWRLASDWPTEADDMGETNSILIVE